MLGRAALLLAQTAHEERLYVELGARADAVRLLPLPLPDIPELPARGYARLYRQHVSQAPQGCDFDFLENGAAVPEPEIF